MWFAGKGLTLSDRTDNLHLIIYILLMERREFIRNSAMAAGALWLCDWEKAFARGRKNSQVGRPWRGWRKGEFQVHFIYTGVCESMFIIMPDGTTMLLDCGDHNAVGRGKLAVPVLPSPERHAGEWIARYVSRVCPAGADVDYMMLSHYHSDHGGCEQFHAGKLDLPDGPYYLSGFSQAAETLHFGKAIDRAWPMYDDPLPPSGGADGYRHFRRFYDYMIRERGLQVEKFRLGEVDQIRMLRHPERYGDFHIRNICANGRIAAPDGTIRDLYAERIRQHNLRSVNENGMSMGMVFSYGPFRFFTAGDFSDGWKNADGSRTEIEDALADVCGMAHVAKVNHHGHYAMPARLIQALQSRVYVSCVWDQLHNVAPVMERLADRTLYPGERVICPGIFPAERRAEDAGAAWLRDVDAASFDGGHIVLNVPRGGREYSITYLTAADESMTVRSVMEFSI